MALSANTVGKLYNAMCLPCDECGNNTIYETHRKITSGGTEADFATIVTTQCDQEVEQ